MTFQEGKKVVCINDRPEYDGELLFGLKKDEIYQLDEIRITPCCGMVLLYVGMKCNTECVDVCSCGKENIIIRPGQKVFYVYTRFRPVDYDFADQVLEAVFEKEINLTI